jgi:Holliday junction resolvase
MINNKRLGTAFEQEICNILAHKGYWVHFIVPDIRGAQPFDIIAVKDGKAIAIDCKTCVAGSFNICRLEDNQIMAFEKWMACGNNEPIIMVKHNEKIYQIPYLEIKDKKSIKLSDTYLI